MKFTNENKDLLNILIAISLIMGFVFLVSFIILIVRDQYGMSCSCRVSLPLVISILTSLGVLVGVLTFYFLSKSHFKEKQKLTINLEKTLNFLDNEEKIIIKALIDKKGKCHQNALSKLTGIDSVKLHRRILNLEQKKILSKKKFGMTNILTLDSDLVDIFIN